MEFRGDNLLDAFARAFDRPIGPYDRFGQKKRTYGKPGSTRSKYPKTPGSGKDKYGNSRHGPKTISNDEAHAPEVDVSEAHLGQLRTIAIRNARSALANADLRVNRPEQGYMELYFTDTGDIERLTGSEAGQARRVFRNGQVRLIFEYNLNKYRNRPFWVLVFGHSHPRQNNSSRARDHAYLRGLSALDRAQLFSLAPVVIKYPPNNDWTWNRPPQPYRQAN